MSNELLRVLGQISARLQYLHSIIEEAKGMLSSTNESARKRGRKKLLAAAAEADVICLALKEEVEGLANGH